MVKKIRAVFGPTFQERVNEAIDKAAHLEAELARERSRANHYTVLVTGIDPWKDHHSFAAARSKQLEHQAVAVALESKVEQAAQAAIELIKQAHE